MKTHLPAFLRQAVITLVCSGAYTLFSGSAIAANEYYTLGSEDTLVVDYSDSSTIVDLQNGILQLEGNTLLNLASTGAGDGRVYTLFTGVSGLVDAQGNEFTLSPTNNSISNFFDVNQPGTGFWAGAKLNFTADGELQLLRHTHEIYDSLIFSTPQTSANFCNHVSITYNYITSASHQSAIYGSNISLNNNGRICFNSNNAFEGGAALYGGTIEINGNGEAVFCENRSSEYSCGAVYAYESIEIKNNGNIDFSKNTAAGYGGAIYGNVITMSNNACLTFTENKSAAEGGAIRAGGNVALNDNGLVLFSKNSTNATDFGAVGGAISAKDRSVKLNNNESVIFCYNSVKSSTGIAIGGAIYANSIQICNNDKVSFFNNSCANSDRYNFSGGGAMYARYGDITLNDNGHVSFVGNVAKTILPKYCSGGAIRTENNLFIRNNGSVVFEKNAEVCGGGGLVQLRSIRVSCGIHDTELSISTAAGKYVEFRDSLYVGGGVIVNLNQKYGEQFQTGDIIFTGATTVDDLYEMKGNVYGTDEEVLASRTSEVNALTNLYGGRLRVEDGAIYQGQGIMVHAGSAATVLVKEATLSHDGFALTFNAGTTLQVQGESLIVGDVLMMAQSVLNLEGETTINGALTLGLGMQLAGNVLTEVQNLQLGESLTLVSGLESLAVQTQNLMRSVEYTTVMEDYEVQASEYFSNLSGKTGLVMRYDSSAGTVSITQTMAVPEPTTVTLSLLALAGLAMRRRRC